MKRLYYIIITVLLSLGFSQNALDSESLELKDNIYFYKDSNELFTGKIYINLLDGLKQHLFLKDGKCYGISTLLHKDGYKVSEGPLIHVDSGCVANGKWKSWWKNGKKQKEGFIKYGKPHGEEIVWYESGQIMRIENFMEGNLDGLGTYWFEDGQIQQKGVHKDNNKNGLWTKWYLNGQKMEEMTFKDGKSDGEYVQWYENGINKLTGWYLNGKQNGKVTLYYENGMKEFEMTMENDELISGKCWDEDGNEKECN